MTTDKFINEFKMYHSLQLWQWKYLCTHEIIQISLLLHKLQICRWKIYYFFVSLDCWQDFSNFFHFRKKYFNILLTMGFVIIFIILRSCTVKKLCLNLPFSSESVNLPTNSLNNVIPLVVRNELSERSVTIYWENHF